MIEVKEVISEQDLIGALSKIFRPDQMIISKKEVEAHSQTCIPFRQIPDVIIYPTEAKQVQDLVLLANELKVPIWTVSTGKNWGYGEKTATYEGGITLVLERMNRILTVDEELGYAVIEPGVTYKELNDHLKTKGYKLWSDSAGTTQFASVIGNALDKGRGLTPYADHFGHLCGLNVILPNGEVLETGGGPTGNNHVRHLYKWGVGPYADGFFTQSNLGIVVSAGIWLMPAPEHSDCGIFEYKADMSLFGSFIDDFRGLIFSGHMKSFPHLANDFAMLCILDQYPKHLLENGELCLSKEGIAQWRKEHGVAPWSFGFGLYGKKGEVAEQKRMIKKTLGKYGQIHFIGAATENSMKGGLIRKLAPLALKLMGKSQVFAQGYIDALNLFKGIPTDRFARQVYLKAQPEKPVADIDPARDQCGFVWIGPVIPLNAHHSMKALEVAQQLFDKYQFEMFIEYIIESPRSSIFLMGVFFDRNDPLDCERAQKWYREVREVFLALGYPPYRVATHCAEETFDSNPVFKNLIHTIKTAVDPKNILAPGRYGTPPRRKKGTSRE